MLIYVLERDGLFYSQFGWSKNLERAMKWSSARDADIGAVDLRREYPALVQGAKVKEIDAQGTMERPRLAETQWNPWGHN
jgi:hypothetical protein